MTFNGFISYSHAADGQLAPAIQRGLHHLAKPWNRRRALWIFRDQTGLSVTPALWTAIREALDKSDYFVLLASPAAAESPWVSREITHWLSTKSAARILPVVTDGHWNWDASRGDFSDDSTAVPQALRGTFDEEPLFLDLRWARDDRHLSMRHSRFRDAIAQLAAPMHGVSKDDLEGEDVRQHRRMRRASFLAAGSLVLLAALAATAAALAAHNADRASVADAESRRQQGLVSQQQRAAERATSEANMQTAIAQRQRELARRATTETHHQELLAARERLIADESAVEATYQQNLARRQQRLADEATTQARQQKQIAMLATAQATRARRIAVEQRRATTRATHDAMRQAKNADKQQRIAIGRRLFNEAREILISDPARAIKIGAAAANIQHDPESRTELVRLMTSTHLTKMDANVREATFRADGILVGCELNGSLTLWDRADSPSALISTQPAGCSKTGAGSLELSANGNTLAMLMENQEVALWDLRNPRRPKRYPRLLHNDPPTNMSFSPDGTTLAITAWSGGVTLWDVEDPRRPKVLGTLTQDRPSLSRRTVFISNETALSIGASVVVWDLTHKAHPTVRLKSRDLTDVLATNVATNTIFARERDDTTSLWNLADPASPRRVSRIEVGKGRPQLAKFNADGQVLTYTDQRGALTVLGIRNITAPTVNRLTVGHDNSPQWLAVNAAGPTVAMGGPDEPTTYWDVTKFRGRPTPQRSIAVDDDIRSMTYGDTDQTLRTSNSDGTLTTWGLQYPKPIATHTLPFFETSKDLYPKPAFSNTGRFLATIPNQRTVTIWNLQGDPQRLTTLTLDSHHEVNAVAMDVDKQLLAAKTSDSVKLYDIHRPGFPVALSTVELPHSNSSPNSVMAFDKQAQKLAVAGWADSIAIFDLKNLRKPRQVASIPFSGFQHQISFSPDGLTLASVSSEEHSVILWDLSEPPHPRAIATLAQDDLRGSNIAFSPDGHTLALDNADSADDSHIVEWSLADLDDLRSSPTEHACATSGGGMTRDEWYRMIPDLTYRSSCASLGPRSSIP